MIDAVTATVVAVVPLIVAATDARDVGDRLTAADVATSVVAVILLLLRRRYPLPVLAVTLIGAVWSMTPDDEHILLQMVAGIVMYTVASTHNRTVAWSAGSAAAAVLFIASVITKSTPWYDGDNLELVAWTGIATAVGDAVRSRRAYLAAMEERAERAERTRTEEARRQVVEERLRIARELHDVVAHHIAVINVQAGVATHLLRDDPVGAEAALAHVRHGGNSVLDELAGILSVLRQPDDPTASAEPLPTLEQLDQLVATFAAVGLDVEWRTAGARRPVPPALALAAYRIVQESLTNAQRHGRGARALLRVDYEPHALSIEVVNDAATSSDDSRIRPGHGITGMRERVAATGGTFDVGRTREGRFRVHATLPLTSAGS